MRACMQYDPQESARIVRRQSSPQTRSHVLPLNVDSRKPATRVLAVVSMLAAMLFLASCSSSSSQGTPPPILSYATTSAVYTLGTAITPNTVTNSGGVASAYGVEPALPAGLSLNLTTGAISGTPTAVVAQATYIVTA